MPEITLLMTAFNAEKYIDNAIESVLRQTFEDFELLIINDGSTDNTVSIIEGYADERIRLINNDQNKGLEFSRNRGLTEAKGKYVAILDSDDIAFHTRLEKQYAYLERNPDCALCGSHADIIDEQGKLTGEQLTGPADPEQFRMRLLFHNFFVNSSVMYRTELVRALGGYRDFAPAEDFELFVRIAQEAKIHNIQEPLVQYRKHHDNISLKQHKKAVEAVSRIKLIQLELLGINPDVYGDVFLNLFFYTYLDSAVSDFRNLLVEFKTVNRKLKIFPVNDFEQLLFNKWYEILYAHKAKGDALKLYTDKRLFNASYATFKQLRRMVKLSLKGIGKKTI